MPFTRFDARGGEPIRYIPWVPIRKAVVVSLVSMVCAGWLTACSKHHEPIDTGKLFKAKSMFGEGYKTKTKGPGDLSPKLLGPQNLPDTVTFDPADCRDTVAGGWVPKGTRGKMSVLTADGEGNRFTAVAAQADRDLPFDAAAVQRCEHTTFEAGKVTGYIDKVPAPQIDGAQTVGWHWELEITVGDQQRSRETYNFAAYLGDAMVLVTASPLAARGQPIPVVNADEARQLLTESVAALRA